MKKIVKNREKIFFYFLYIFVYDNIVFLDLIPILKENKKCKKKQKKNLY